RAARAAVAAPPRVGRLEPAVPPLAAGEAGGALAGLARVDRRLAERELARHGGLEIQAGALVGRAAIAQHAARREGGDLTGERLGGGPGLADGHDAISETDS